MKQMFTRLTAIFILLVFVSSCHPTYRTHRYVNRERRSHWWHAHHFRPHTRSGGSYW